MPIAIEALEPAQFDQWLLSQGGTLKGAAAATTAEAAAPAAAPAAKL